MIYNFGINDVPGDAEPTSIDHKAYSMWRGMIRRCYHGHDNIRNITYSSTTVCDDWKYYSNFKKWFLNNYKDGFQLDKDIIGGLSNEYSPDTCAFVPSIINSCIIDGNRGISTTPLGVSYVSKSDKYRPALSKFGKSVKNFGFTETPMESHHIWQKEKANYLGELIKLHSNDLTLEVISGLQRRIDILNDDRLNERETKTLSKI